MIMNVSVNTNTAVQSSWLRGELTDHLDFSSSYIMYIARPTKACLRNAKSNIAESVMSVFDIGLHSSLGC